MEVWTWRFLVPLFRAKSHGEERSRLNAHLEAVCGHRHAVWDYLHTGELSPLRPYEGVATSAPILPQPPTHTFTTIPSWLATGHIASCSSADAQRTGEAVLNVLQHLEDLAMEEHPGHLRGH